MKQLTDRQRTLIFINLMITGIATSMLTTAMTTALPPVVKYFGISMTTGQWLTSGYSDGYGRLEIDLCIHHGHHALFSDHVGGEFSGCA